MLRVAFWPAEGSDDCHAQSDCGLSPTSMKGIEVLCKCCKWYCERRCIIKHYTTPSFGESELAGKRWLRLCNTSTVDSYFLGMPVHVCHRSNHYSFEEMGIITAIAGYLGLSDFLARLLPMPKPFRNSYPPPEPSLRPLQQPRIRLPVSITNASIDPANSQAHSLLLTRIPVELRLLIWEYTIGSADSNDVLHLEPVDGTLRHCRCHESDFSKLGFRHVCWNSVWRKADRDQSLYSVWEPRKTRKIRSLILTCRSMYG